MSTKMTLSDWDRNVSKHLQFIEAGADMAMRHARALPCRPDFESLAEDDLAKARAVLQTALQNIVAAQAFYSTKPPERDHAA